jgi:putative Holliday junction resolvase
LIEKNPPVYEDPVMKRCLGIDVGKKRIGVAVSDPLGITAQPMETVIRDGQGSEWKRFSELLNKFEVVRVVVGLPINMDGTEGEQAEAARLFAKTFSRKFPQVEVVFQDERLTSAASERLLIEAGIRRNTRKMKRDLIASTLILQTWLDAHRQT